jgi:hypothetical protein
MDINFERLIKATAVAIDRERVINTTSDAVVKFEKVIDSIAVVVLRERTMKVIYVVTALLVVAIALPSIS